MNAPEGSKIPHVILILYGIQGSGKTLLFKLIRSVIDPSSIEVLSMPRDEREGVQQLDHHWCAFYDNVTSLPSWISDRLCRAATGGGFSKRELYTDDEDIIYNFRRCVGLNSINIAAQRGDLLDRGLLFGLLDIPKDKRKDEKLLLAEFEGKKAEILGGLLDALVQAIKLYPTVNLKELFRMADFTKWGCAIAKALGKTEREFIDAYETKVRAQIEEAAHSSSVATVLLDYMDRREDWEGTPSNLYKDLLECARHLGISTRQKAWPKAPHILVRQLNELIPSLKALGLEVVTGVKSGSARKIIMRNTVPSVPSIPSGISERQKDDGRDAKDASVITSSRFRLDDVISCKQMEKSSVGKCDCCGKKPSILTHAVRTFSDFYQVCEDCAGTVKAHLKKRMEDL